MKHKADLFPSLALELRNQSRQGLRLFMRGGVPVGQPLELQACLAQSLLREVDLPMFKRIFIAAAYQKRKPIAIRIEELAKVGPIALRFVIRHEARRGEVEQAIVTVHGAMEFV